MNNKITNIVYNQNIIKNEKLLNLIINYYDQHNIDIDIFKLNYYILTKYINNIIHNDFSINLNIIYKLLGFNNIFFAKIYLFKKFIINKDFIINFNKKFINNKYKYKCNIYLTIDCYKKFCLYINNTKSLEIYDNYINLEFIYNKFLEQKLLNKSKDKLYKSKDKLYESKDKLYESKDEFNKTETEFNESKDEFNESKDEFNKTETEFNESKDEFNKSNDEFNESKDEFNKSNDCMICNICKLFN
jgi:hypothetical protein